MNERLTNLSQPETKVVAKKLVLSGYSSRQVEAILGIDHSTAILYSRETTPDEMKEFSTIFDNWLLEQKRKGVALVNRRLLELIPKERRIDQVVKAGEFLEGRNNQTAVQVNTQINLKGTNGQEIEI